MLDASCQSFACKVWYLHRRMLSRTDDPCPGYMINNLTTGMLVRDDGSPPRNVRAFNTGSQVLDLKLQIPTNAERWGGTNSLSI